MDNPVVVSARHEDAPWIAADLAILHEAAMDIRLDVDFHLLAAKRTRDDELLGHFRNPTAMPVIGAFPLVTWRCSATAMSTAHG